MKPNPKILRELGFRYNRKDKIWRHHTQEIAWATKTLRTCPKVTVGWIVTCLLRDAFSDGAAALRSHVPINPYSDRP